MVNVIIYLNKEHNPRKLIDALLRKGLAAKVSTDIDNVSFFLEGGEIVTKGRTIITLQTKALLFSAIDKFLQEWFGEQIPMCSVPITQVNRTFDEFIRTNTTFDHE
ncbi:MAG: divalent cation tolerance protein CutA [Bacteroidota bacterium]|jgi:uncharacterized protein involved in tolerance to divalent cations